MIVLCFCHSSFDGFDGFRGSNIVVHDNLQVGIKVSRQSGLDDLPDFWQPPFPGSPILSKEGSSRRNKIIQQEDELEPCVWIPQRFSEILQ